MNIIFIAPPAAGKGTQSELLCNKYNMKHISAGDLLRDAINENTEESKKIEKNIEQGQLVSDEYIINLVKNKIVENDNYIFDGVPRDIKQAKLLDELLNSLNRKIDFVIYLKIDKELAIKRILGRLSCPTCDKVYNDQIKELMPKVSNICDNCKSVLIKRIDDNIDSFNKRFDTYIKQTEPLLNYFKDKLYEINSTDKYEIFKQIESIVGVSNDNN